MAITQVGIPFINKNKLDLFLNYTIVEVEDAINDVSESDAYSIISALEKGKENKLPILLVRKYDSNQEDYIYILSYKEGYGVYQATGIGSFQSHDKVIYFRYTLGTDPTGVFHHEVTTFDILTSNDTKNYPTLSGNNNFTGTNTFTKAATFSDSITVGKNDTYAKIINFGSTDKQIKFDGSSPTITIKTLGDTAPIYLSPYYDSDAEVFKGGNVVLDSTLKTVEGQSIYGIGNVDLGLSNYAKLTSSNTFTGTDNVFNSKLTLGETNDSGVSIYFDKDNDTLKFAFNEDELALDLDIGDTNGDIITTANIASNTSNKLDKVTSQGGYRVYAISGAGSQGTVDYSPTSTGSTIMSRDAQGKAQVATPTASDSVKSIANVEYVKNNSSKLTVTDNEDGTLTLSF